MADRMCEREFNSSKSSLGHVLTFNFSPEESVEVNLEAGKLFRLQKSSMDILKKRR